MNEIKAKTVGVVISHGERWKFLDKTIDAILLNPNIMRLIIVDNGILAKNELLTKIKPYGDRIILTGEGKNLGSAGAFAIGLEHARKEDCDFVYLSDDDMIPEPNFIEKYLLAREMIPDEKKVVCAHRIDVPSSSDIFHSTGEPIAYGSHTFFDIFSMKKFAYYFRFAFSSSSRKLYNNLTWPIVPVKGFVYGSAFLPIEAVREAPLPDKTLFLYGDDIEYAWGVENAGYNAYVCYFPIIHDIDLTFGTDSHIKGLVKKTTQEFKVYYRIRNMVRLSLKHSKQSKLSLYSSIFAWMFGITAIAIIVSGFKIETWNRIKLIYTAAYTGYKYPEKSFDDIKTKQP